MSQTLVMSMFALSIGEVSTLESGFGTAAAYSYFVKPMPPSKEASHGPDS